MTISKCLILKHLSKGGEQINFCMNVYFWHEHSHVKDSSASDPSERPRPSPGQTLENGEDSPGQIMDTADLLLKPVHTGSIDHSFLIPDDCSPRLLTYRNPLLLLSFQTTVVASPTESMAHAIWMELVSVFSSPVRSAPVRSIMWPYQND